MPNQNEPTQNPNPVSPSVDQPTGSGATPPVPPVIFPQSDLPPLSPEFQNLPETKSADTLPAKEDSGSGAPPDMSSVTPKVKKKFGGGKIIATILGLVVLVGGVGAGILLIKQPQLFNQKAAVTQGHWCEGACANPDGSCINSNGCQTRDGNSYPMVRSWCDKVCSGGCGPNCAPGVNYQVTLRETTSNMSYANEGCGSEQIDVFNAPDFNCPNPPCGNWAHKDYANDCGGGGTPPPSVVPTPTPTAAATPTPTAPPLSCGSICDPPPNRNLCPSPLTCNLLPGLGYYGCSNPACLNQGNCICTSTPTPTPTPGVTPTPAPLVCNSICTPPGNGINSVPAGSCPAGTSCILDSNSSTRTYRCRNTLCSSDSDCVCNGTPQPTATPRPPAPYCVAVTTYRSSATTVSTTVTTTTQTTGTSGTTWTIIPDSERPSLKPGETIYFCVSGYRPSGTFDKARFTINGVRQAETTLKRPGSTDICMSYKIPAGTKSLTILGEIHDTVYGWFGGISTN